MAVRQAAVRSDYIVFYPVSTRWVDNDIYGHVNNAVYYTYFDSAVNQYLIEQGELDIHSGEVVGFVVNSGCEYSSPVAYPDELEVGIRADKIGNSSVQYGVAIFKKGAVEASAYGHFVHVFVDQNSNKPVSIPIAIHTALQAIAKSD
jgi:acyl-CoA thioester hydrolase